MTAAAVGPPPEPRRPLFADASPAQVRAALIPEETVEFDHQWREVMTSVALAPFAELRAMLEVAPWNGDPFNKPFAVRKRAPKFYAGPVGTRVIGVGREGQARLAEP